jgi:hypothetical protein
LKEPLKKEEPSNKKYYIESLVVGVIGSGNTSKMFHAVDLDCKEYAIKMYVKNLDGNTYIKKKDFEEKGWLSVTTEVRNFKLIYPKLNVVYKKLNKCHCIVMPFFLNLSQRTNVRAAWRTFKMCSKCLHRRISNIRMKTSVGGMWDFTKESAFSMTLQSSRHRRAIVLLRDTWRTSRKERTWSLTVRVRHFQGENRKIKRVSSKRKLKSHELFCY